MCAGCPDGPALSRAPVPFPSTDPRPSNPFISTPLSPFREGFIKNRYIARTFIMPGQQKRKKNVRKKLNPCRGVFEGKNVMLVDDSIVRGTTSEQIVQMVRAAGAKKVFFCSASPAIRYPNVYGIDMPVQAELIAFGRDEAEIAQAISADWVVYQDMDDLTDAVRACNPEIQLFDCSCFSGPSLLCVYTCMYVV